MRKMFICISLAHHVARHPFDTIFKHFFLSDLGDYFLNDIYQRMEIEDDRCFYLEFIKNVSSRYYI